MIRTPHRDATCAFLRVRGIETGIHYPLPGHHLWGQILPLVVFGAVIFTLSVLRFRKSLD